jgi:hypothetical protein
MVTGYSLLDVWGRRDERYQRRISQAEYEAVRDWRAAEVAAATTPGLDEARLYLLNWSPRMEPTNDAKAIINRNPHPLTIVASPET